MKKKAIGIICLLMLLAFIGVAWAAITATWDGPTTGDPATGYRIYYYPESDSTQTQMIDTGSTATSYDLTSVLSDIPPDTPYVFYVIAYNSAGAGPRSNLYTYVRPMEPPGACSNFQIN